VQVVREKKCWVKKYFNSVSVDSNLFLYLFKNKTKISTKKARQIVYFFPALFCWIGGKKKSGSRIRDKHLGSATLQTTTVVMPKL
jgi:hypothetical protein